MNLGVEQESEILGGGRRVSETKYPFLGPSQDAIELKKLVRQIFWLS
ncbi:MAG: hypothetical protein JGK12_29250 [Microcoleus sp. PH2017_01_SCD_O_A]|nr:MULTISPECIES: hypothetical protein [unclassified Microcoleus]MCC3428518.1 hypothetical protein [Microcoleus sp. PH2017_04_SCI_O_A]MCC3427892.1 hypothetical protein [Microcoleus sp. PH2017_01_SCD_O_A]MCC3437804.1 hypothetical protein [Microcoleus sp. PH2017_05_CCC_O_A]MCC3575631.1 hypothetical protein [Microcoleus sp. PH2017_34_RAT_O_A]MCC3613324.1 hypothetical protein [Microcoleus sp. PH2017_40_RAT_O_B]